MVIGPTISEIQKSTYLMDVDKIYVNFIEDHQVIRTQVSKYLELQSDFEVNIVASSVEDFFRQLNKLSLSGPQILLLDIGLPGKSGLDAIPDLMAAVDDLDIIMLTTYEEETKILKALCSGATSYLSKKSSLSEIANTVRIVHNGGSYMSPNIAREIVDHLIGGRKSKATILSGRQKEILERLVDGESYNQISTELGISYETVRTHIKGMYKTLQVNKKSQAIAMYLRGEIK